MTGWSSRPAPSQGQRPANWQRIARLQLSRYPLCAICERKGRVTAAKECDHIVPISKGGGHDYDNLQSVCATCHRSKTHRESMEAKGYKPKPEIGQDGWPI